ncbi:MAG: hypothetical protein IT186_16030 [Acidobacteria bacterium]|nr:hypothetical protein [Acidobacteriota bacterium]
MLTASALLSAPGLAVVPLPGGQLRLSGPGTSAAAEALRSDPALKASLWRTLRLQAGLGCLDCGAEIDDGLVFCPACFDVRETPAERERRLSHRLANLPKLLARECGACGAAMTGTALGDAVCSARCWERGDE